MGAGAGTGGRGGALDVALPGRARADGGTAARRDGKIGPPPRLVLSEGEQQQIHDRIEHIYARMSTGSAEEDRSVLARLGRSVSRLAGAAMLDMVRDGRTRQMIALLAVHHGEEEAARIAERFVAWASSEGLID